MFVSNRPRHAAAIERRQSTGKRAAARRRCQPRQHLHRRRRGRGARPWPAPAASTAGSAPATTPTSPIPTPRCARCSACWPRLVREVHQAAVAAPPRRPAARAPRWRLPAAARFTTVLTRDVIVATLVGDMRAGRSVVYADFVGYDEVAHHSGVERYDALETLRRLDHEFARLRAGRRAGWRGPTGSSCCPTTARARARRSAPGTAGRSRSWSGAACCRRGRRRRRAGRVGQPARSRGGTPAARSPRSPPGRGWRPESPARAGTRGRRRGRGRRAVRLLAARAADAGRRRRAGDRGHGARVRQLRPGLPDPGPDAG